MAIPTTDKSSAGLAFASAAVFLTASASINAVYGFNRADGLLSWVWAGVAVACSVTFALSWPALLRAIEHRHWPQVLTAFLALAITGAFSISAALGAAAGGRAFAERVEVSATSSRARAQESYDQAKNAFDNLRPSRPEAEVQALLASARPVCRVVVNSRRRRTVCGPPTSLTAELARAKRRAELESRIERASKTLSAGPARVANSDARALASFTGLALPTTNKLLTVLAVLLLECGSGLSLAVGLSLQAGRPRELHESAAEAQPAPQPVPAPAAVDAPRTARVDPAVPPPRTALSVAHAPGPAAQRLLDHLRTGGGQVVVSQRQLGKDLGVSRVRISQLLTRLEAQGLVEVSASTAGTTIEIID